MARSQGRCREREGISGPVAAPVRVRLLGGGSASGGLAGWGHGVTLGEASWSPWTSHCIGPLWMLWAGRGGWVCVYWDSHP